MPNFCHSAKASGVGPISTLSLSLSEPSGFKRGLPVLCGCVGLIRRESNGIENGDSS